MASTIFPADLTCEFLRNPVGIDVLHPRLSWRLSAADPDARGLKQTAWQILVASTRALLASDAGDLWDSGKVNGDESLHITYLGTPLVNEQVCHWKVRAWDQDDQPSAWSEPAHWSIGLIGPGWTLPPFRDGVPCPIPLPAWPAWIGAPAAVDATENSFLPAVMLRKEFTVSQPVERAVLYASALGVYDLYLNGSPVSDRVLAPEWTDYFQRGQYQAYDVTALLASPANALAVVVAPGWYAGQLGLGNLSIGGRMVGHYGRHPRFIGCLRLLLRDGSVQTVMTDTTWKCSTEGPVRRADLLAGETRDARREMPGWDRAGYDDRAWRPIVSGMGPNLSWQPNQPIRVTQTIRPVAVSAPQPGVHVYDMGQNMVGWVRLKVRAAAGTLVRLRHAEMLLPDGMIYRENLRLRGSNTHSAQQEDVFITAGGGEETFEPRFTYHGFRYVEVAGLADAPALADVTGCVIHSDSPMVGSFECSSPLINRIHGAIQWTLRGNLHSTPTDCPQRDERLGWMGDIMIFCQTAMFNMDMSAFFTKWLRDVAEAQARDGRFPEFAPNPYFSDVRLSGNPGWADAGVVIPWRVFVNYADRRILETMYDACRRFIEWVRRHNPDLIWRDRSQLGFAYGDWLNSDTWIDIPGVPSTGGALRHDIFATAYFAYSAQTLANIANQLGKPHEANQWTALARDIRAAFVRAFVQPDGRIEGDTQAGYALALQFDLLPQTLRDAAVEHMLRRIDDAGARLTTGIHATVRLMLELTRRGHTDKAYEQLMRTSLPSWGYMIEQGATTIWERWDGVVAGRGFQRPTMNSFNHCALGAVGEWIYRVIAGLNPDESAPGWKHFTIRPIPGGGLTFARAHYDSIRGRIESSWRIDQQTFTLDVTIPPNTTATVQLPDGSEVVTVSSGQHRFTCSAGAVTN